MFTVNELSENKWEPTKISDTCILGEDKLALLYNFTSVYTTIPSCRRDPLEKHLDPSGPIVPRWRYVWLSVKYIGD